MKTGWMSILYAGRCMSPQDGAFLRHFDSMDAAALTASSAVLKDMKSTPVWRLTARPWKGAAI